MVAATAATANSVVVRAAVAGVGVSAKEAGDALVAPAKATAEEEEQDQEDSAEDSADDTADLGSGEPAIAAVVRADDAAIAQVGVPGGVGGDGKGECIGCCDCRRKYFCI